MLNPFLTSFAICFGLLLIIRGAKKYARYIQERKENDDDLNHFI